jgi:broad specificity phosphatase PhoE
MPRKSTHRAASRKRPGRIRFVLVRHGQAGDKPPPTRPEYGAPLTPLGRRQARRVAKRLARERFDHIYASDLSRAHETARAIVAFHEDTPLTVDGDIREVGGEHIIRRPGRRSEEVRRRTRRERQRVERFWRRALRRHRDGERVLIVAHGNLIRLLVPLMAGADPKRAMRLETHNASVTEVLAFKGGPAPWGGKAMVLLANCTKHLRPTQVT